VTCDPGLIFFRLGLCQLCPPIIPLIKQRSQRSGTMNSLLILLVSPYACQGPDRQLAHLHVDITLRYQIISGPKRSMGSQFPVSIIIR
jgi:hypothetical protein